MIDRTQEDIAQDHRLDALEKDVTTLRAKMDATMQTLVKHTDKINQHEGRLATLDPLRILLEDVDAIRNLIREVMPTRKK